MTTNQTIDGVPRELIESLLAVSGTVEYARARKELRALLDAHAENMIDVSATDWAAIQEAASESTWMPPEYMRNDWVDDVCRFLREGAAAQLGAEGFYQLIDDSDLKKILEFLGDGDLPTKSFFLRPDAAYLANVSMHLVREVQALRIKIAAQPQANVSLTDEGEMPAAQPQGEPVADLIRLDRSYRNGLMAGFQFGITSDEKGYAACIQRYNAGIQEAKAEQPAPVAVVMPERPYASDEDQQSMTDYEIGIGNGACEMWDKIKALNLSP